MGEEHFVSNESGGLNVGLSLFADTMPSAGEITLFTVDVIQEPLDVFPIEFGIIEETGLNVVGGIFETSKLEFVGNGRCGGCGM